ncbi:exodeoxyribonuclease VII large subunit [Mycolicibacterium elephantis]|uniref:exodeoxyribonuclease VII large subunit n=1 Tax=Mycolicibacterium elephantis TaxID=81858 RepID=UPI0007E9F097|nr:exodeoxyribonuclease VII large subunit [Mycolicibacterium elephantis]OBA89452.1 exodeoxyribonuclease VII large subunit [Mycolicibacterium elephantis]
MTEAEPGKSPDNPWPVRAVATRVAKYIDRLGTVWVEGQIAQLNFRPTVVFILLRDPAADMSLTVVCPRDLVANAPVELTEGVQVVMHGKPQFHTGRGSFSLRVSEIRAVGLGELLARIERLRKLLEAEGLFDPRLKRPLPFLPNTVGLITGRASAAERDVVSVAQSRWPAVRFAIRNTAVQGPNTVPQIVDALRDLDANAEVDVIVIARGGGDIDALLPFYDETLCREIAKCSTPVVSAIGHEPDNPLCDLVADVRAATPTDAAKRIVPDAAAEQARIADLCRRGGRALRNWVHREQHTLDQLRSRPVLAQPLAAINARAEEVHRALAAARRDITRLVAAEADRVGHLSARLSTLGPAATLARGYAVVQTMPGAQVLRTTADAPAGTRLRVRVADGAISAVSDGPEGPEGTDR